MYVLIYYAGYRPLTWVVWPPTKKCVPTPMFLSFQLSVGDTQLQDKLWKTTGKHTPEQC